MGRQPQATRHARARCQQRAIRREAIEAALDYGRRRSAGNGTYEFFLGRRDVAAAWRRGVDLHRFERTAVLVTAYLMILTVYKAQRPAKRREA